MTSPSNTTSGSELAARAEASAWITRLHGPSRTPEMEQGFRRWLEERPENAREFEGLTEVWDLVAGGAPARGAPRLERWEQSAEAQELSALRQQGRSPLQRLPSTRVWAVAAAVLLAIASWMVVMRGWPHTRYVTGIGEQRVVQLDDGTRVSLDADSRLSVQYGHEIRHIRLDRGEALFEVAKEPGRPFVVVAGDDRITALATSFVVRRDAGRTAVTLVEGKVSVLSGGDAAAGSDVRILSPGQRLTLAPANRPKIDTPAMETVAAWRRGEVALDDTPLAQAIAEMNRYDKTQIVIGDAGIESLIVSGLYHAGDNEGFAQSVARMYRLEMARADGKIRLQRPAGR